MLTIIKKCTLFMASIIMLNTCVLPYATVLATKPSVTQNDKSKVNQNQSSDASQKKSEKENEEIDENPSLTDSWYKVVTLNWKAITKADALNIAGPIAGVFCLYAITRYLPAYPKTSADNPTNNEPQNNNPDATDQTKPITPINSMNLDPDQSNSTETAPGGTNNGVIHVEVIDPNSQKKSESDKTKPDNKPSQELTVSSPSIEVKTIKTLPQTGASCALHTLKNASDILRILRKPAIIALENNFKDIRIRISKKLISEHSKNKAIELFDEKGNSGTWRTLIKNRRAQPVLKNCIFEKLTRSIPLTEDQNRNYIAQLEDYILNLNRWFIVRLQSQDGKDCYARPLRPARPNSEFMENASRNALNNIATACANQLVTIDQPINVITNNQDELTQNLIDIVHDYNQALLNGNGVRDTYTVSINLLNSNDLRRNFGNAMSKENLLANAPQRVELRGDDLDSDELYYIMTHGGPQHGEVPDKENMSIITRLPKPEWAVNGNGHSFDEALIAVKEKIQADNCLHAFLIRLGFSTEVNDFDDERSQSSQGTHWFTVVLHRVNGQNHYIIADSLNVGRAENPDVLYLIRTLEDPTILSIIDALES